MPIVDSHVHTSDCWFEPVESLLDVMARNGVDGAVLVQMNGQADNSYLFECVRRFPGRFAPVVMVDTDAPTACDDLRRLAEKGASGIRLRPHTRSPGKDPLAIWRTAEELGLAVSCGSSTGAVYVGTEEFARLVESVPNLPIVLEHLGSTTRAEKSAAEWEAIPRMMALARYPNVYVKIPGLAEFCKRAMPPRTPFPFEEPIPPLFEQAYEAFGPRRMMWGSDYPPVSFRGGGYHIALRFPRERFASKSQEEQDLIFGGVASSVFPLRG